jgi:hypothetical protein
MTERARIAGVGFGQYVDAVFGREREFRFDVDLVASGHDAGGDLRPDTAHALEFA